MVKIASWCSYSFYFYHDKGISTRLSGFTNSITNGLHCISFAGYDTGEELTKKDLPLSLSCTILEKTHSVHDKTQNSAQPMIDKICEEIENTMNTIEKDPNLRTKIITSLKNNRSYFEPENSATKLLDLFRKQ